MATKEDTPFGLCACGCGNPAPIALRNRSSPIQRMVKGQPQKWIAGHHKTALSHQLAKRTEKACGKCREVKPLTEFYRNKHKLGHYCKPCWSGIVAAQIKKNPQRKKDAGARYFLANKADLCAKSAKWRKDNPERSRATRAAWGRANPDKVRANAARWADKNREKIRARQRAYTRANPESARERCNLRRRRSRLAGGRGITRAQWHTLVGDSLGLCAYCNNPCKPTLEHIGPIAKGGEHDIDNAAVICLACNRSKNDTPLIVWLAQRARSRAVA